MNLFNTLIFICQKLTFTFKLTGRNNFIKCKTNFTRLEDIQGELLHQRQQVEKLP